MFDFFKNWQRKRILTQMKSVRRSKKIANINDVHTIGLVFTVGEESHWTLLYHFAKLMEDLGKKVMMIGLQEADTTLDYIITHSQTIICREKEDLDKLGFPKAGTVERFTNQHFDLLIDTTVEPNFFAQYVVLKTLADLKVTYADVNEEEYDDDIFDLTIQGEGSINHREYLNNVVQYLKMIQK